MKKPKKPSSRKAPPPSAKPSELTDTELDQVSGGIKFAEHHVRQIAGATAVQITQDVTLNKSKVANKAADAVDAYIRQ